jgi:hypothetical protein
MGFHFRAIMGMGKTRAQSSVLVTGALSFFLSMMTIMADRGTK